MGGTTVKLVGKGLSVLFVDLRFESSSIAEIACDQD